jgi:hypothetical protein
MPMSRDEQQRLLDKLLPNSGYEADPEPQRDYFRPAAPAERTADEDSLSQMYPTHKEEDTQSSPRGMTDFMPQMSQRRGPDAYGSGYSSSNSSSNSSSSGESMDSAGAANNDDDEDDVVMIGQQDSSSQSGAAQQRDDKPSDAGGNNEQVYFVSVKGDSPSDASRGPGRKVIIATENEVRGYQG